MYPSSRMNRSSSYTHLFENKEESEKGRGEKSADSSVSVTDGRPTSHVNNLIMTSRYGSSNSLATPVVMARRGTLADTLEDKRRRDSMSGQLKGLHLPSKTSLCGDALGGSKIGAGADLPTIGGRRTMPKALMPKEQLRKNSGYQSVIGSSLAFLGTGSGVSGPMLSSTSSAGQPRRSSISSCYPVRPHQSSSAAASKIQSTVSSTNASAPAESNNSPSPRPLSAQLSTPGDVMLRRGSSPAVISGPKRPSANVVNESIYPLLRSAFGKDTDVRKEDVTLKTTTFTVRRPERPASSIEYSDYSSDSKRMNGTVEPEVHAMAIESNLKVSSYNSPIPNKFNSVQPIYLTTTPPTSQPLKFSAQAASTNNSVEGNAFSDQTVPSTSSLVSNSEGSLGYVTEVNRIPVAVDSDWYDPIPVTPRKQILSTQMSHGGSPAGTPATADTSAPYTSFFKQLHIAGDSSTSTLESNENTVANTAPPALPSSPPPLPLSMAPHSLGACPPLLQTSSFSVGYPLVSSETDEWSTASTSSWSSTIKGSDVPTTTLSIVHRATDSFNTEDSGLDRSDEGLIGIDGGFDAGVDSSADELDLKVDRPRLGKERMNSATKFSREDVTSDRHSSRGYSPREEHQVTTDQVIIGGEGPRDIGGHLSPALSDADSGFGYAKRQLKLTEPAVDHSVVEVEGEQINNTKTQGIISQLLAETNSSIDSLSSMFGPQENYIPLESNTSTGNTELEKSDIIHKEDARPENHLITIYQLSSISDVDVSANDQSTESKQNLTSMIITPPKLPFHLPPEMPLFAPPTLQQDVPPARISTPSPALLEPCAGQTQNTDHQSEHGIKLLSASDNDVNKTEECLVIPKVSKVSEKISSVSEQVGRVNVSNEPNNASEILGSGIMTVEIEKGNLGIGFCIEGGKGSALGDRPISIKRLFKGNATVQHTLKAGDEIMTVNGRDLSVMSQYEAWNYIKSTPDGTVTIVILRQ